MRPLWDAQSSQVTTRRVCKDEHQSRRLPPSTHIFRRPEALGESNLSPLPPKGSPRDQNMAFLFKSKKNHDRGLGSRDGPASGSVSSTQSATARVRDEKGSRSTPTGSLNSLDNDGSVGSPEQQNYGRPRGQTLEGQHQHQQQQQQQQAPSQMQSRDPQQQPPSDLPVSHVYQFYTSNSSHIVLRQAWSTCDESS